MEIDHSTRAASDSGLVTLTIQQTATALIVETTRGDDHETVTFNLDGSTVMSPGDVRSTSRWNGSTLITQTVHVISGKSATVEETWHLDPSGNSLRIEKTMTVEHGYEGILAASNYAKSLNVFKKIKP